MIDSFVTFFNVNSSLSENNDLYEAFCTQFGGQSFGEGLFNTFPSEKRSYWNSVIGEYFPKYRGNISVIGYDWLGRCFARLKNQDHVFLFEIGTGDVLDIGCTVEDLLNKEIPLYTNDCLAINFFNKWKEFSNKQIPYGSCVGYRIPLFVGGKDDVSNLEISDMDVYWTIVGQLLSGGK